MRAFDESAESFPPNHLPEFSQERLLKGTPLTGATRQPQGSTDSVATFRILGELGQGGMGVVYRAEQVYPRRIVALKVLKQAVADEQGRKRFIREAEITGRLNHRGIAQVHFAGVLQDGLPFMAMEYVPGTNLLAYVQAQRLAVTARLELFAKVCDIIAYAHRQGVIHRDLKPSNILVDAQGEPKILDFGLAAGPLDAQATQLTLPGQMVGTLDYMSPEQAEGRTEDVDQRSDVYSLGVLLYELLSARRPFDFSRVSLVDAVRTIKESLPPQLSTVNHRLRGDLEIIVHKTLQKEKDRRYQAVEEMAADIRHWLAQEPIQARRPSHWYRTTRFVRRHRVFVGSVTLIILALSAGLVLAAYQAARANREATRAAEEARRANTERVNAQISEAKAELSLAGITAGSGDVTAARAHYEAAWRLLEQNHRSTLEAVLGLWKLDQEFARPIAVLQTKAADIQHLALSSDQKHLAIGYSDGRIEIRNPLRNTLEWTLRSRPVEIKLSPTGQYLLICGSNSQEVWSVASQRRVFLAVTGFLSSDQLAITDDTYAFPTAERKVRVEYLGKPALGLDLSLSSRTTKAIAIAGSTVTIVGDDWMTTRFSLDSGKSVNLGVLPGTNSNPVVLSPDGSHAAIAGESGVRIFNLEALHETGHLAGFSGREFLGFANASIAFAKSQDGSQFACFDLAGTVKRRVATSTAGPMAVSRDLAVAVDAHRDLVLWSIAPLPETRRLAEGTRPAAAALSSDGYVAALAEDGGQIALVDTIGGHLLGRLPVGGIPKFIQFDRKTDSLATLLDGGRVAVWDILGAGPTLESSDTIAGCLAYATTGNLLVAADSSRPPRLWVYRKTHNGSWTGSSAAVTSSPIALALSADDSELALTLPDGRIELWTIRDAEPIHRKAGKSDAAWATPYLAGRDVAGRRLVLLDPQTGRSHDIPLNFPGEIYDLSLGTMPVLAAVDPTCLDIVDLNSGDRPCRLPLPLAGALRVALSADGTRVLLAGKQGVVLADLTVPGRLRDLESCRSPNGSWSDTSVLRQWLRAGGLEPLAAEAFPTTPVPGDLANGYARWAAGDLSVAASVFRNAEGLNPGTRRLLLAALDRNAALPR